MIREYIYAYSAVCPHDGTMDSLILPGVDAEEMSIFLEEVSNRHRDDYILMFMDCAAWHKANSLRTPENIKLLNLPPYSPELNPTEHIWEEIREKWFSNKVFKDLNGVEKQLVKGLCSLENNKRKVKSITGFDWILTINLIAN
jgi:transposase